MQRKSSVCCQFDKSLFAGDIRVTLAPERKHEFANYYQQTKWRSLCGYQLTGGRDVRNGPRLHQPTLEPCRCGPHSAHGDITASVFLFFRPSAHPAFRTDAYWEYWESARPEIWSKNTSSAFTSTLILIGLVLPQGKIIMTAACLTYLKLGRCVFVRLMANIFLKIFYFNLQSRRNSEKKSFLCRWTTPTPTY